MTEPSQDDPGILWLLNELQDTDANRRWVAIKSVETRHLTDKRIAEALRKVADADVDSNNRRAAEEKLSRPTSSSPPASEMGCAGILMFGVIGAFFGYVVTYSLWYGPFRPTNPGGDEGFGIIFIAPAGAVVGALIATVFAAIKG